MTIQTSIILLASGVALMPPGPLHAVEPLTSTQETRVDAVSAEHVPANAYNRAMAGKEITDLCPDHVCDAPPVLLRARAPVYPAAELRAGLEGKAAVRFEIDATGQTRNPIVQSATSKTFGLAALEAVKGWTFRPATLRGKPVAYGPALQIFPFELRD